MYLKIDFSKKGMIKKYGGKWNNEHKLGVYYKKYL